MPLLETLSAAHLFSYLQLSHKCLLLKHITVKYESIYHREVREYTSGNENCRNKIEILFLLFFSMVHLMGFGQCCCNFVLIWKSSLMIVNRSLCMLCLAALGNEAIFSLHQVHYLSRKIFNLMEQVMSLLSSCGSWEMLLFICILLTFDIYIFSQ